MINEITDVDPQEELEEIYCEIGKALSQWNLVEYGVCNIFATAINQRIDDICGSAMTAYWSIVSFDARVKMTESAVQFRIERVNSKKLKWDSVSQKLKKLAKQRNQIAHGTVTRIEMLNKDNIRELEVFLYPSFYHFSMDRINKILSSGESKPTNRMYARDVKQIRKSFENMHSELIDFNSNFCELIYGKID